MKLTDKEWDPIAYCIYEWESDNRKPFGDIRDAINAVYAKRNVAQPVVAEQPVDVDVMEIICNVYCDNRLGLIPWTQTPPRTKSDIKNGITAVAHALLDRMRGPVTAGELEGVSGLYWKASLAKIIDLRIDRILRPKKQTPVEMVTELIDAYRGGVAKDIAEKIIEEMEAHGDDGREPGDTRDEESLEDHNIQGLGAYRDVFDADGEQ
jgi:hypothetical protein